MMLVAKAREKTIKELEKRMEKTLVHQENPNWEDLAENKDLEEGIPCLTAGFSQTIVRGPARRRSRGRLTRSLPLFVGIKATCC